MSKKNIVEYETSQMSYLSNQKQQQKSFKKGSLIKKIEMYPKEQKKQTKKQLNFGSFPPISFDNNQKDQKQYSFECSPSGNFSQQLHNLGEEYMIRIHESSNKNKTPNFIQNPSLAQQSSFFSATFDENLIKQLNKTKNIKKIANNFYKNIEKVKFQLKQILSLLKEEGKNFYSLVKIKKMFELTLNEYGVKLNQEKESLSLIIKHKEKLIEELSSAKQILSNTLRRVQQKNEFQNQIVQEKLKNKQFENQQIRNQYYKISEKYDKAKYQNERLVKQNNQLHEKIFDLQQKMEGIDLEVEKKFKHFLASFPLQFLQKANHLKEKIKSIESEIDVDGSKNRKLSMSRYATEPNLKSFFAGSEYKREKSPMNNCKSINLNISENFTELPVDSRVEQTPSNNERRMWRQHSEVNLKFNKKDRRKLYEEENKVGRSYQNLKQTSQEELDQSFDTNYSINNLEGRFELMRKKIHKNVQMLKRERL